MSELVEVPTTASPTEPAMRAWCVQIFALADLPEATATAEALTTLLGGRGTVLRSTDGHDHFVVVETDDDPTTIDLVATTVVNHSEHAELMHRSVAGVLDAAGRVR